MLKQSKSHTTRLLCPLPRKIKRALNWWEIIFYSCVINSHSLMHTHIYSLSPSYTHAFIHTLTHAHIHPYTYIWTYRITHSCTHSYTPSLPHTLIHSCIHLFTLSLTRTLPHAHTPLLAHTPIHSLIHLILPYSFFTWNFFILFLSFYRRWSTRLKQWQKRRRQNMS